MTSIHIHRFRWAWIEGQINAVIHYVIKFCSRTMGGGGNESNARVWERERGGSSLHAGYMHRWQFRQNEILMGSWAHNVLVLYIKAVANVSRLMLAPMPHNQFNRIAPRCTPPLRILRMKTVANTHSMNGIPTNKNHIHPDMIRLSGDLNAGSLYSRASTSQWDYFWIFINHQME